ncbi:hypothetical protein [Thalassotalea euphylliae]|uniref:Uncharacterized protein n=1 Tax=Thalassotalea euphylliae TaxID=1655234 RepID=A0A3E0U234_9GAMM|nr:hypothetical protein [Thalassotalea euphylliae]REL31006.1 hypothetical protein DXX94_09950 [Thalassotalea euphylliae]REL34087.1 hypothetical protein DXX92_01260 [Thalassotalea euphylliae]
MSITVVTIAAILAVLTIYFLINSYAPLTNKINSAIGISSRSRALTYLIVGLLGYVPLYYYNDFDNKLKLANQYGYDNYQSYQQDLQRATTHDLELTKYQAIMVNAKQAGFDDYLAYQQHLEAQSYDYPDYQSYKRDLQLAKSYGFPLEVYRVAKEDASAQNFEYFDDYLIAREKNSLKKKLTLVPSSDGDFTIDNVPLGAKKNELLSLIENCKISQMPDYSFPITKTLAPRKEALVDHFFPETSTNSNFGLTNYNMNFSVMPGLDLKAITKYEMKCDEGRYDLWFLNSDNTLVFYEKTLKMPNVYQFDRTLERLERIFWAKCDDEFEIGLETSFEEHGTRAVKNMYCKNFQDYIIATIVDGPIITGVRQEPDIHIGYLSQRQWKKYINNLHSVKGKRGITQFSQNDGKNKTRTFESRI